MKILAKTPTGYIIDASDCEIANLVGYYSNHSGEAARPKVGSEIKVNEMFMQLYAIKDISRQVKTIADAAKAVAESVRTKMPVIEPIIASIEKSAPHE